MYVVVQHEMKDPETALSRGEKLIENESASATIGRRCIAADDAPARGRNT